MIFIVLRLASAFLLFGALGSQTAGYYHAIRWVVFLVAAFGCYRSIRGRFVVWAWLFGITAFALNPFVSLPLDRGMWGAVYAGAGLVMLVSILGTWRR